MDGESQDNAFHLGYWQACVDFANLVNSGVDHLVISEWMESVEAWAIRSQPFEPPPVIDVSNADHDESEKQQFTHDIRGEG